MIAALFALAAAMIIGGCAAVIQGFPYVRLESGLAMVIAGSVAASSGAVLLGLGVLALSFRGVARAIAQAPTRGAREAAPASAPATVEEGRPRTPPILPAAPAFIVPSAVEPPFDPERPRIEPNLDLRTGAEPVLPVAADLPKPLRAEPVPQPPAPPVVPQGPVPPPKEAPTSEGPAPMAVIAPEDDLFVAPEPPPGRVAEPSARPNRDPEPAAPKPESRTVVGRYASGGNTYVMFENGSIEAETPQGRFTFSSLDELKAFVDGGGESGTRGAA
ncbi:hypothetical protein SAMN05216360_111124 [Methylobacterium phyllostachyos]|uniref:Uncharacterized protein n=1 Tax=Methylobacterium phyllostachyos TaxID=582672 RepID=A0A1H0EBX5_9HYPH|nr:hypothetical protein [Methylobacterium phyllostachyos]SDN79818.1 hypothetical protein SAMN05216360_111124 [Methylobacterium phyllostachyos]